MARGGVETRRGIGGTGLEAARGRARDDGMGNATARRGSRRWRHARRGSGMATATARQRRRAARSGDATGGRRGAGLGAAWRGSARLGGARRDGDRRRDSDAARARGGDGTAQCGRGGGRARGPHQADGVQ
uniref:Enoyl-CoA-hydratase-like n=1 Tax=Oryza sativa subsp. japonica TaxID=39947 RepID=Q5VMG2_ORYSJ|nr:enoyl-CoA-hydratase-like [Oryza sativa Japonica Group]